ncbi:Transcription-repair-coupling factor [Roseimaritima ulvae]|uniref:Transcription-repair-coupling factor n=2 Tax=Roseimaritima ulvae TaxID=980254 RepID=A0A5B9QJ32_9BACT|nr:Transcription-repair-coupling factor [Roseimaritima ulvae]
MTKLAPAQRIELTALPQQMAQAAGFDAHLDDWQAGKTLWFEGVEGSVRSLLAAALAPHNRATLVLLPEAVDAEIVAADLQAFGVPNVCSLPLSANTQAPESIRDADFADRLQVLQRLRQLDDESEPLIVTAYVGAALQAVPTPQAIADATRMLRVGATLDLEDTRRWLAEAGFHPATAVELPGEFCQRGGILDIYSPDQPLPIRIELFGDDVESIRRFDPASQRSTETLNEVELAAVGTSVSTPGQLIDYLPPDAAVLVVHPERCQSSATALLKRSGASGDFGSWEDLLASFHGHRVALGCDLAPGDAGNLVPLRTATIESFIGNLEHVQERIDSVAAGHRVIVVGDTAAEAERLSELLRSTDAAKHGRLNVTVASLSSGFRLTAAEVLVLTGAELFHRSTVRRVKTRVRGKPIDSFLQLESGDLVVHLSHGIGLYRGMELIEKQGHGQEHLVIEFAGGTKIYVPAARIGLIQRYVGGSKTRPRLAKIGAAAWSKNKKAAQAAVHDMASELLEVQATRDSRVGLTFNVDSHWQQQFDAIFPYTETPDQMRAIDALKEDMQRPRPMDRLICGDVGYGKTEVAMRAAFKAVDSGFQVAVLVPTTVLAEQHYHSFSTRMAEFPFDIAKLSRFVSAKDQREAVKRLKSGNIDIVIGTHRLASKDVDFYNLGLVIIDEEQRFGVAVKERLKTLHSNVDVLTLSATPIPRTLHMALVGVRDISNLETPPEDRMPVETHVGRWDNSLIRDAIVRELNRGGQIYFVHNRIGDMATIAERIKQIVPEVRIGMGHGQMAEGELEQVMVGFVERKFDLLLATTIIESGLDIPNANTIFVNEADRYGLADLHQLRGRVGRYKNQAYCYLMVDRNKFLTPEASKRLRAIEEFSQMGAGFAISMRDLEIRGAGNLLGTQQSGHIAAVGYELYCQLLEDAVRKAQNLPPKLSAEVDIDLPVEAYLPPDYVPDMRHKIDLYRRISRIDGATQITEIREEMLDRFGPPPEPVERMLQLAELRLDAAIWLISSVTSEPRFLVLHYSDASRIEQLARRSKLPVRIVDGRKAYVPAKDLDPDDPTGIGWLRLARSVLAL